MAGFYKMADCGEKDEEFHVSTMFSYYKFPYFSTIFLFVIILGIINTGLAMIERSIDITDLLMMLPLSSASQSFSNPGRFWCVWMSSSMSNIALIVECHARSNKGTVAPMSIGESSTSSDTIILLIFCAVLYVQQITKSTAKAFKC
jgi:hypothetical protein